MKEQAKMAIEEILKNAFSTFDQCSNLTLRKSLIQSYFDMAYGIASFITNYGGGFDEEMVDWWNEEINPQFLEIMKN